jgi:hypothetical protein
VEHRRRLSKIGCRNQLIRSRIFDFDKAGCRTSVEKVERQGRGEHRGILALVGQGISRESEQQTRPKSKSGHGKEKIIQGIGIHATMDTEHHGPPVCVGGSGQTNADTAKDVGASGASTQSSVLAETLVERAAEAAFDTYYKARASAYGSGVGKMYDENENWPSFLAIGKTCLDRGWSPAEYVNDVFASLATNGGLVLPANLTTKSAVSYFENRLKGCELPPEELWAASERTVTELVVDGATEKQVLMNPMLSLPAWFRIFYPEELDSDLVATYGERAKSELTKELEDFIASKNQSSLDTFNGLWQSPGSQPPNTKPC